MEAPENRESDELTRPEPEHTGSIWTHPYAIYVWLTCILFAVILFAGWMAWTNGWLPQR